MNRPIPIKQWKGLGKASDDNEAIASLAALSPLEYDRVRELEAETMGVRVSTLDAEVKKVRGEREPGEAGGFDLSDPKPWLEAVDGAVLLDSLTEIIARHVILPPSAAVAVALWIIHSHAHETAAISPILAVTSPTPECGKTTLLTMLGGLARRPLMASNITSAAVFRAVEKWQPSLIIDEADTFLRSSDELRGVLNSGHSRATAFVVRTVGDDHEPRLFKTWSPKVIALIGKLPDTLESRAIHIELRRIAVGERIVRLRSDRLKDFEPLQQQCWRWACDHEQQLRAADPDMPTTMHGRAADNWRHFIAIADLAGGEWPEKARRAAETLSNGRDGKTEAVMLLEDIRLIFQEKKKDKLTSAEIAAELGAMEDKPWPESSKGKPITPTQIARLLRPFHIVPGTIRTDIDTGKGYKLHAFDDAFRRYLPSQAVTTSQRLENKASSDLQAVTNDAFVTVEEAVKSLQHKACDVVTVRKPIADGEAMVEPSASHVQGGTDAKSPPQSAQGNAGTDAFDDGFVAVEEGDTWESEL